VLGERLVLDRRAFGVGLTGVGAALMGAGALQLGGCAPSQPDK
jgi:hypothetical protein